MLLWPEFSRDWRFTIRNGQLWLWRLRSLNSRERMDFSLTIQIQKMRVDGVTAWVNLKPEDLRTAQRSSGRKKSGRKNSFFLLPGLVCCLDSLRIGLGSGTLRRATHLRILLIQAFFYPETLPLKYQIPGCPVTRWNHTWKWPHIVNHHRADTVYTTIIRTAS